MRALGCSGVSFCMLVVLSIAFSEPVFALDAQFGDTSVEVSGVSPGGEVAALWRSEIEDSIPRVYRGFEFAEDSDGDGVVKLELKKSAAIGGATWAIVDVTTGEMLALQLWGPTKAPTNMTQSVTTRTLELKPDATLRAPGGAVDLLLIRPGIGAWHTRLYDGTSSDEDGGIRHWVGTSLSSLAPEGRAPAPPLQSASGDKVISLDSRSTLLCVGVVA